MEDLKNIVICYKCKKAHKKKPLSRKEEAICTECGSLLYKSTEGLEYKVLIYSFTALIFFAISLLYPIITIDIAGNDSLLNIPDAVYHLYSDGYILVGIFALIVLILFPLTIMFLLFLFSVFVILKINKTVSKNILIILEYLKPWSMVDIFFVSVLVSMVKIFDYALIEFDVAFFSVIIYITIEIYLTRHVYLETLWDMWERVYE